MNPSLFSVPVQGREPDERYTPKWVFDGLGLVFDTDPASPIEGGDCVPARTKYTRSEDGLTKPWHGLVWLNPPFSNAAKWADRFRAHGNGVFLGPIANGRWWLDLAHAADLLWLCADFAFTHPEHAGKRSSMPLCFAAMGAEAVTGLERLAVSGRHRGFLATRHDPPEGGGVSVRRSPRKPQPADRSGMTSFPLVIVDSPWPARAGHLCRDVTRELDPRTYPVQGLGPEEVVVLIENDPLNDAATERGWSCVLDRRCVAPNNA